MQERRKNVRTETLVELAEIVLKIKIVQFNENSLKLFGGAAVSTKFSPPYAILFMANLKNGILENTELHPRK